MSKECTVLPSRYCFSLVWARDLPGGIGCMENIFALYLMSSGSRCFISDP